MVDLGILFHGMQIKNLHQAHLQEVGLMPIPTDHVNFYGNGCLISHGTTFG